MKDIKPRYFSQFLSRVHKAAGNLNLSIEYVDKLNGGLVRLKKGRESCMLGTAPIKLWPFNSAISMSVTNDKELVIRILREHKIGSPETRLGFADVNRFSHMKNPPPSIFEVLRKAPLNYPLVVKPNDAKGGEGLSILYEPSFLEKAIAHAARFYNAVIVQEYVSGQDCRVYCLNGKPLLMLKREIGSLRGDGKHSVTQLMAENERFRRLEKTNEGFRISHGSFIAKYKDFIPKMGEETAFFPVANLSQAGSSGGIISEFNKTWQDICARIADAIDLRFFALDCRLPSLESPPVILEINANPGIEMVFQESEKTGEAFLENLLSEALEGSMKVGGTVSPCKAARR